MDDCTGSGMKSNSADTGLTRMAHTGSVLTSLWKTSASLAGLRFLMWGCDYGVVTMEKTMNLYVVTFTREGQAGYRSCYVAADSITGAINSVLRVEGAAAVDVSNVGRTATVIVQQD